MRVADETKRNCSGRGAERPDRGEETHDGHHDAAGDGRPLEVAGLALVLGRLDDREQVAGEQCAAEGEHEPRQQVLSEEHAVMMPCNTDIHGLPPRRTGHT
jgi:hypothetical protein